MFREPWFRIIDIIDPRGASLAEIARQEAEKAGVTVEDIRGMRRQRNLVRVRFAVYRRAKLERPDLTSSQVARFMRKDSSTVRHAWAMMENAA